MILGALQAGGGQKWLQKQMEANPAAFMTLVGKLLPLQVTGKDGGPLEHRIDTPAKETREEWLARQAKGQSAVCALRLAAQSNDDERGHCEDEIERRLRSSTVPTTQLINRLQNHVPLTESCA
jgi:hypothetical protein